MRFYRTGLLNFEASSRIFRSSLIMHLANRLQASQQGCTRLSQHIRYNKLPNFRECRHPSYTVPSSIATSAKSLHVWRASSGYR